MARNEQELRDHYLELGPGFIAEPDEVLDATIRIAVSMLARIEAAGETLHARTFIDLADGAWLDQHGKERSVLRLEGETDAAYRPRVKQIEDKVTRPAILAAVDAILLVGTSRMEEHLADGAYSDFPGLQGYADHAVTYDAIRSFTVFISEQLQRRNDTAYALPGTTIGTLSYAGTDADANVSAFADGVEAVAGDIYSRIWSEIGRASCRERVYGTV